MATIPTKPTFNTLAQDDIINLAEKAAGVTISGTAPIGSDVVLFAYKTGNKLYESHKAVVDSTGKWTYLITDADYTAGIVEMRARTVDSVGELSAAVIKKIVIDTQAPIITFDNVTDDNVINRVEKSAGVTLTGNVETGSTLALTVNNKIVQATIDAKTNKWSYPLSTDDYPATATTINAVAIATDKAGNPSMPVNKIITLDLLDKPAIDTTANFYYSTNLSFNSVSLPFDRDQTTDTPSSLFKTIDKDGSVTNYHGTFVRETPTSPIAAGSKITSFEGLSSKGIQQFSFATSKGFDGLALKQAIQSNNKETFFKIVLGGNDSIVGSSQEDVLGGYGGNNTIDGGAGNDTIFFSGNAADYQIIPASVSNSFLTVTNTKTGETDSLINVESFQFTDKVVQTSSSTQTPTTSTSKGAIATVFSSIDMSAADLLTDKVVSSSSSLIGLQSDDGSHAEFNGSYVLTGTSTPLIKSGTVATITGTGLGNKTGYKIQTGSANDATVFEKNIRANTDQELFKYGFSGNDMINGSPENDTLSGYAGNDTIDGGNGKDTVFFSGNSVDYKITPTASSVTVQNTKTGEIDTLTNVEQLQFLDKTIATPTATPVVTPPVTPVVTTGNSITINAPTASVSNTSKINASNVTTASDDKITSTIANLVNATIDGGAGNDTLTISDATAPFWITSRELSTPGFVVLTNVETLNMSNVGGDVLITGVNTIKTVIGGVGNDKINDAVANNSIDGGAGNDIITISGFNDTISGGLGIDKFVYPRISTTNMLANFNGTITDFVSNTDKFDFSNNQIPVSTTTSTSSNSSIVGAWKATTPFGDAIATFMSDDTYFYADPNGGAERGTYSWDSAKSSFSVTGNTFDTSALGFNPSSTPTAVTFSGTSASWSVQGVKITANPITDSAKSIVGSWYAKGLGQAGGDNMFTFLSDGTYVLTDNGDPVLDPYGKKGMEKGTYTWDANTGKLTTTTTVDTNGEWGFSGTTAVTLKITANSALASFTDTDGATGSGTLTKVVSPTTAPTTAPTTSSMVNAPVLFLGNKANLAQAQSSITANSDKLQVVYQQDKNILWADVNNDGALNASDLQITLNGVKTLAAADFV